MPATRDKRSVIVDPAYHLLKSQDLYGSHEGTVLKTTKTNRKRKLYENEVAYLLQHIKMLHLQFFLPPCTPHSQA